MRSATATSAGVTGTGRRWAARRSGAVLAAAIGAVSLLSACSGSGNAATTSSGPAASRPSSSTPVAASSAAPRPVTTDATISIAASARNGMNPTDPVTVGVAGGRLTSVTMTNAAGKHVTAALAAGGTGWHTTEDLGYGKTYTVLAHALGTDGRTSTRTRTFTTLDPAGTIDVDLDRMGGYALTGGTTYGVAIVPVVHFELPVTNEAAAQKALQITASKPVAGVWSWIDNQDVAYRPESYWPADTSVTLAANEYGVDLGGGSYGSSDESTTFTVGRKQLTIADDNAPAAVDKVRVYNGAGQVLRTMNTSMGQHSGETVNGQYINFYTLRGTYTVLAHENPAIMSSQSYGLPADAPHGYGKLSVPYSTKISTDGIYLHEYNSTIPQQNSGQDVSEGCLNLRTSDAAWYYDHSLIGDPVVVHGASGAPLIQPWEGGYWSIPWASWRSGSALS